MVFMIIMHKSGQSFGSNNKKRIIIDKVNWLTGLFQLSKEIASIEKYFVVCFCFLELL